MKKHKFIGTGVLALFTGIGASLCCIAPIFPLLVLITVFAMGSLRFPWFLGKVGAHPFKTKALQTVPHVTLQFHIKGMTCRGCEALLKTPSVN